MKSKFDPGDLQILSNKIRNQGRIPETSQSTLNKLDLKKNTLKEPQLHEKRTVYRILFMNSFLGDRLKTKTYLKPKRYF